MKTKQILIGKGVLSWFRHERVTDRYGSVAMFNEDSQSKHVDDGAILYTDLIKQNEGKSGKLICHVIKTRQSTHIGDLFHGFYPSTPEVGAKITIGKGKLFQASLDDEPCVGLMPEDERETFWLNPKQLYKVHEQTVELYFIPN